MKTKTMTLANPISREPRDRIQLARPGKFTHQKWGEFTLDRDVFESFIDNFHLMPMSKPEIPIDYNHKFEKAGGWIKGLEVGEDGHLYANSVEWTPQAVEEIKSGQYKYLSIAFTGKGVDSKGVEIGPALIAVSLTNIPFLRGMEPVSVELEDGQEEATQIYECEFDLGEVAKFQSISPSNRSNFAYVDDEGTGHLPMDSQSIEKSMSSLEGISLDDETKKKVARKLAGRARRMNVPVSKEFAKKWDLDLSAPKPVVTSSTTSTSGSGVVNVTLTISGETEVDEEDETKTPQTPEETPGDEGEAMLESKIREVLKLSEKESIEDALAAVQKTRELISGQGENSVVTYFDFVKQGEKVTRLERQLAEKDVELLKKDESHKKELARRDAEALVGKAIAEGRITPKMKADWALDMAVRSPDEFTRVLASLPRMVRVQEEGSDEEAVVMSAANQFNAAIDTLREEYRKKDPNRVPDLRTLQIEVATRDPKLYTEYMEEVRIR